MVFSAFARSLLSGVPPVAARHFSSTIGGLPYIPLVTLGKTRMGLIKWFLGRGGAKVIADFYGPQILGAREFFDSQIDYEKALCHFSVLGVIVGCTNRIAHASQNKRPDEAADLLMAVLDRIFGQSITGVNICMKLAREADAFQNGDRPKFDTEMYEHHRFLGAAHGEALLTIRDFVKLKPPPQLFELLVQQSEVLRTVREDSSRKDVASRPKKDQAPRVRPEKRVLTEGQEEVIARLRSANEFQLARSLEGAWEQGLRGRAPEESEAHVTMWDGTPLSEAIQLNQPAPTATQASPSSNHSPSGSASDNHPARNRLATRLRQASMTPQQQHRAYETARRATEAQRKDPQSSTPSAPADQPLNSTTPSQKKSPSASAPVKGGAMLTRLKLASLTPKQRLEVMEEARRTTEAHGKDSQMSSLPESAKPPDSEQGIRRGLFALPALQESSQEEKEVLSDEGRAVSSSGDERRSDANRVATTDQKPPSAYRYWKPPVGPVIATYGQVADRVYVIAPQGEQPGAPSLFDSGTPYDTNYSYTPAFINTCTEITREEALKLAPRLAERVKE